MLFVAVLTGWGVVMGLKAWRSWAGGKDVAPVAYGLVSASCFVTAMALGVTANG